jgi:hypothetical protein
MTLYCDETGDYPSEHDMRERMPRKTIGDLRRAGLETRFDRRQRMKLIAKTLKSGSPVDAR